MGGKGLSAIEHRIMMKAPHWAGTPAMWQRSYFYVKNLTSNGDWVNLPPYNAAPLTGRLPSWSHQVKTLTPAGAAAVARL